MPFFFFFCLFSGDLGRGNGGLRDLLGLKSRLSSVFIFEQVPFEQMTVPFSSFEVLGGSEACVGANQAQAERSPFPASILRDAKMVEENQGSGSLSDGWAEGGNAPRPTARNGFQRNSFLGTV